MARKYRVPRTHRRLRNYNWIDFDFDERAIVGWLGAFERSDK